MKTSLQTILYSLFSLLPLGVWADADLRIGAASGGQQTLGGVVSWFVGTVNTLVFIIMAVALLLFIWGIVVYIFKLGSTRGEQSKGPQFMFWGIMILFVMSSLWGLVWFVGGSIFNV